MPIDTHLKDSLHKMNEEFGGDNMYKMMGPTLLGYSSTDSSRMYMFTSHLKQILTLKNPDIARLLTGFENPIGKYNKAYKLFKDSNWRVESIIKKFNSDISPMIMVLYNTKTKTYDMIEDKIAESLTEKFGYLYNSEYMKSLQVGDILDVDKCIYKSTSYDDDMNYRYGKNARVFYTTATDTLEDAIPIRKGWAKNVVSNEVDEVNVSLNDNDILLDLYGDGNIENYKPFPDVGEKVKDSSICATRRINKNHLLYDFQAENLRTPYDTDVEYFVPPDSIIYDINVYCNSDKELPDNIFYKKIKYYRDINMEYARKVKEECEKIQNSGKKYTNNINYYMSRVDKYNDPEYQWVIKDKPFGNTIIEFKVYSDMPLEIGAKLSGRYGNKGVISQIIGTDQIIGNKVELVDDERMPYYYDENGNKVHVDIVLSQSGAIRRLNPEQLCEVELNFIAERIQMKVKSLSTMEEKADMIFKFLGLVNKNFQVYYMNLYDGNDLFIEMDNLKFKISNDLAKEKFIKSIEDNGFYLVRPPHNPILYDEIKELYKEFDWIKPIQLKINLFGIKDRDILRKGIVGYQYMIILKQTSRKSFSARSTYRINRANVPTKDIAKKTNKSSYAKTAVRLSEIYALFPSISGRDLAEFNIFMRSSALGRRSLKRILEADGNPMNIKKLKVQESYTNANADILNARLKSIGLGLRFVKDGEKSVPDAYGDEIVPLHIRGFIIYDKYSTYDTYSRLFALYYEEANNFIMVESYNGEKSDMIWDKLLKENKEAKELLNSLNINNSSDLANLKVLTANKQNEIYSTSDIIEDAE